MKLSQLKKEIKSIEKERKLVKQMLSGDVNPKDLSKNINFKTILMIVESPNKARIIANFFSKPSKRILKDLNIYEVSLGDKLLLISYSGGHILDLIKKEYIWGVLNLENKFYPVYDSIKKCIDKLGEIHQVVDDTDKCKIIQQDKRILINSLQESSLEVDEIYIATDPDTEGEKIAYDIYCLLKPFNINIFRIEYHEVTKRAILQAIDNKRQIDENWVRAQILRRISDRWVGFALSLDLQKHFKGKNYSAGRVQTPILGWVIQRDKQSKEKKALINIYFDKKLKEDTIKGFYYKKLLTIEEENIDLVKDLSKVNYIEVKVLKQIEYDINPLPPFTTEYMLEEASAKHGFGVDYTMKLAQDLFELGFITYHRTDSTHISNFGINIAGQYLKEKGWEEYFYPRHWGSEGAHEAIRPTKNYDVQELKKLIKAGIISVNLSYDHFRLYDLIFKRFIASQMKAFRVLNREIEIVFLPKYKKTITIPVEILKDGWNLVIPYGIYDIKQGENTVKIEVKFLPKILPYTQGSLIIQMKERGLGRPSTYATIVSTLLKRKYIIQLPKTGWLKPTKKGILIYEYLKNKYFDLISEDFTKDLEKKMDEVEKGRDHIQILNDLFEKLKSIESFRNILK